MPTDEAVRARNAGKDAVAMRTIWSVDLAGLRFRCLADMRTFVVQIRQGTWQELSGFRGRDPVEMLNRLTSSHYIAELLRMRVSKLRAYPPDSPP